MRRKYSFIACCLISSIFIFYRFSYSERGGNKELQVTTWDALGYYLYLPSLFIYHDMKELKWFPGIDKEYALSGGWFYQANKLENGNYAFKYLGGVAILESPFFLAGHAAAKIFGYKQDGFSFPYQVAVAMGALVYLIIALFFLRKVLLRFFDDYTTTIALVLVFLATNAIQYVSLDSAESHSFILPLYALVLYTTLKWHEKPRILWAVLTGYIIGLATISRPTEIIMLFIPLLWNTHTKESSRTKWQQFNQHRKHLLLALLGGFIGILPQLIYWKYATGSFIYDVGSKWDFLTPHLRVLTGWEKGWFIYTPVTLFFIAGMFFIKRYPFKISVITFCLLNIYIIISWHVWRYGASYSARALVQSYPVFALPFAGFINRMRSLKYSPLLLLPGLFLIYLNLFQIKQYNETILHYDDMNRRYYGRIFLNSHPDPLDMSMLDTPEMLGSEDGYRYTILYSADSSSDVMIAGGTEANIYETLLGDHIQSNRKDNEWLKIEAQIQAREGFYSGYLNSELQDSDSVKRNRIRLFSPISKSGVSNPYEFYVKVPPEFSLSRFRLFLSSTNNFQGTVEKLKISLLTPSPKIH